VSVCELANGRLTPIPLRRDFDQPPAGRGTIAALNPAERSEFAKCVVQWCQLLQSERSVRVKQIAIDAPSDYCSPNLTRRLSERALGRAGISCFATPTHRQFKEKIQKSQEHLRRGGELWKLPNANQLWMLVGFTLFDELRTAGLKCIETYPHAIIRELKCTGARKSTADGLNEQMKRAASVLGYSLQQLSGHLGLMGFGSRHDKLDALLSAWTASLPEKHRKVYGVAPGDAIVVPRTSVICGTMHPQSLHA